MLVVFLYKEVFALVGVTLMKMKKKKLILILVVMCLCISGGGFLFTLSQIKSRHDVAGGIISNLQNLYANFLYLKIHGYNLNIYPYDLELNLIGLLSSLSPEGKYYKEDLYAFYVMDSGYWIGYNLTPYYQYFLWQTNIGLLYGIDSAGSSTRERLQGLSRSYPLYGSDNIKTPPLSADVLYHYKMSDNVVWRYIAR
jgi:hypothetical protein